MSRKKKEKKTIEELILILEQNIQEYNVHKSIEYFKKLKKACRKIVLFTVNPTTPPPPPKP